MTKRAIRLLIVVLVVAGHSKSVVSGNIPGDIVFTRQGDTVGFAPATFPHWVHRIQFKCYACHDDIFPMKRGATPMTMEVMAAGRSCGKCHNGKVAFGIDTCNRCHLGP